MISVVGDGLNGWRALRETETVGRLGALVRPDGRCFLFLRDGAAADVCGALVDSALPALGQEAEVYVEIDERAVDVQTVLAERGFAVNRKEHRYLLPTDLSAVSKHPVLPAGFGVISVVQAEVDRWRELDDALRDQVPGAAGWRNNPQEFARQTFDDPEFDPDTYLLAVDERSGDYVGLVRVWNRPAVPRLGLIGTLPSYRRQGLAIGLIGVAFGVLHRRGQQEASCEVDETNAASTSLMMLLHARRVGGNVELVRRARAPRS